MTSAVGLFLRTTLLLCTFHALNVAVCSLPDRKLKLASQGHPPPPSHSAVRAWYDDMSERMQKAGETLRLHAAHGSRAVTHIKREEDTDLRSPVTRADIASDQILRKGLRNDVFPIVDEESAAKAATNAGGNASSTWMWIDPLDATREFSEGLDEFVSVMACLSHEGDPVAGIIYFPFRTSCNFNPRSSICMLGAYKLDGSTSHGSDGSWVMAGASSQSQLDPRNMDKDAILKNMTIIMSRTKSHQSSSNDIFLAGNNELNPPTFSYAGGAGYKIVEVLQGRAAAYVHTTNIKGWDVCAGDALLRAAGGMLTDLLGNSIQYDPTDPILRSGVFATIHMTNPTQRLSFLQSFASKAGEASGHYKEKKNKSARKVNPGNVIFMILGVAVLRLVLPKYWYESPSSKVQFKSKSKSSEKHSKASESPQKSWKHLCFCFLGIQFCYITWGVSQERVMGHTYGAKNESFNHSSVLLLFNKVVSAFLASILLFTDSTSKNGTNVSQATRMSAYVGSVPPLLFAYASLSNGISSWCQYESLKHTIFPIVVVFKASKMIPVMLIGQLSLFQRSYKTVDYVIASSIAFGVIIAVLGGNPMKSGSDNLTLSGGLVGIILMSFYAASDAFTSQWQGYLFRTYGVSSLQMMFVTNSLSAGMLFFSVLASGDLIDAVDFALRHPSFVFHAAFLAVSSASGQYFIFLTIQHHGPLMFATIMVVRNLVSTVLSSVLFSHELSSQTVAGFCWVFATLFINVWRKARL